MVVACSAAVSRKFTAWNGTVITDDVCIDSSCIIGTAYVVTCPLVFADRHARTCIDVVRFPDADRGSPSELFPAAVGSIVVFHARGVFSCIVVAPGCGAVGHPVVFARSRPVNIVVAGHVQDWFAILTRGVTRALIVLHVLMLPVLLPRVTMRTNGTGRTVQSDVPFRMVREYRARFHLGQSATESSRHPVHETNALLVRAKEIECRCGRAEPAG